MPQKLACRMGMGESPDEKRRGPAPKPCCPAHALSYLAFIFAILISLCLSGRAPFAREARVVSVSCANIFLARHLQRLVTSESSITLIQKLFEGENL